MTRISVFVDAANLFYVQHRLGWHVNPQRLLDHIVGYDQLADAFWYTGVRVGAPGENDQEKFLKWLTHVGYTVRRKSVKSFVNVERGATVEKANLDVEIVMDMLTTADTYDVAALVSGDGDFERIVEYLRSRGKRVRVYSIDSVIAFELRNTVGTHYVDFWTIRADVERLEDAPAIPPLVPTANPPIHVPLHNAAAMLAQVQATPPEPPVGLVNIIIPETTASGVEAAPEITIPAEPAPPDADAITIVETAAPAAPPLES
ncbi:MAG: NYN domain-containing protein [Planctomycetes bacterium]|nr:NYN domain-containing protein [Planctomycetota bacterium]